MMMTKLIMVNVKDDFGEQDDDDIGGYDENDELILKKMMMAVIILMTEILCHKKMEKQPQ